MVLALLLAVSLMGLAEATCHSSARDCEFKYEAWSDCDPCSGLVSRPLNITAPPEFGGLPCPSALAQTKMCGPGGDCPSALPCPGQFDCRLLGNTAATQCIPYGLVCNGQQDCANNRDEANCTRQEFSRAEEKCMGLAVIPYLDEIGAGVAVGAGEPQAKVLDNERFQGYCRKAFDGDAAKVYRLPFNANAFHFHVRSTDELRVQSFDSLAAYSREKEREESSSSHSGGGGHGGLFGFNFHASASRSYTHRQTWKQIFSGMKDTNNLLFTVRAEVEVAQFILKDSGLLLDAYLEESISRLPLAYNAQPYMDLFAEYGLFYAHSGALGGRYEHGYIFAMETMKTANQTVTSMENCLKKSVSGGLGWGPFGASASHSSSKCTSAGGKVVESTEVARLAQDKVVHVEGGTSESAGALSGAALQGNASFPFTKYQRWVSGVAANPVLLRRSLRPLCHLILSSNSEHREQKHRNCLQAAQVFVQPWSAGHCRQCESGGRSVRMGGECRCLCPAGFIGQACADTVRDTDFVQAYQYVMGRPLPGFPRDARMRGADEAGDNGSPPQSHLKLITTGNPPMAVNPPDMNRLRLGAYDSILKSKGDRLYYLHSTTGFFRNERGKFTGGYTVVHLSEYLREEGQTPVDFASIHPCSDPQTIVVCRIRDYDIDLRHNFVLSVEVETERSEGRADAAKSTSIFTIDGATGKLLREIKVPCGGSLSKIGFYVATTCDDSILLSCPGWELATVKTFAADGRPLGLGQLEGYANIVGLQHFDGQVWIRDENNLLAATEMGAWDGIFSYKLPALPADKGPVPIYSQLFRDYAGYLLVAQAHETGLNHGADNVKVAILDTSGKTPRPLAFIQLAAWNRCLDVVAYRGKLYTLCQEAQGIEKAILAFDYLK